MRRWFLFSICALLGLVLLVGGLLVPAHLRAVDVSVVESAGQGTLTLAERGTDLVREKQLGAAELVWRASADLALTDSPALGLAVTNLVTQSAELRIWGALPPEGLGSPASSRSPIKREEVSRVLSQPGFGTTPITDLMVLRENRERALELLRVSNRPGVQNLLSCRERANTVVFSPSQSASGQALDAAISLAGLLLREQLLTRGLTDALSKAALQASFGNDSKPLEQMLLDVMSLGQRMNWGQLTTFVSRIETAETLRLLADQTRNADGRLPVVFSGVVLSENPAGVAGYLAEFSQTGLTDLETSLRFGSGGVAELLRSHKRLTQSGFQQRLPQAAVLDSAARLAAESCVKMPLVALVAKWLMYALSGFFIAAAMHFARRPVKALERPLEVRGFHFARESLFALGFLLVVLLMSEPFLTQEGQKQKVESHFRLRLPTLGSLVQARPPIPTRSFMNQVNLLTLLLFFVLQALIYTACVIKLAEIRRQQVPPRMKLRLLDNEEHLFDAGLYLGFVGTIISLILVSMGITSFSLMAAYSSTSFGIIFVSFFKIFHLRAARRQLLMQAESMSAFTAQP